MSGDLDVIEVMKTHFEDEGITTTDQKGLEDVLEALNKDKRFGFDEKTRKAYAKGFFRMAGDAGWIDVEDFIDEFIRMNIFKAVRNVVKDMDAWDDDGDGGISQQELLLALSPLLGETEAARRVTYCFKKIDTNKDNMLTKKELQDWYKIEEQNLKDRRGGKKVLKETEHERKIRRQKRSQEATEIAGECFEGTLPVGTELTDVEIQAIWNKYDADDSGTIDGDEMDGLVRDLLQSLHDNCGALVRSTLEAHFGSDNKKAGIKGITEEQELAIQSSIADAQQQLEEMKPNKKEKLVKKLKASLLDDNGECNKKEFCESIKDVFKKAHKKQDLSKKKLIRRASTMMKQD